MVSRSGHLPVPGFAVRDEIDDLFGSANPNPARSGCPSAETLRALARRERPIDDAAYEHLGFCSPCYQEFRAFQEAQATAVETAPTPRWSWTAAVAAGLLLALVGTWLSTRHQNGPLASSVPTIQLARVALDLRPFAVSRAPEGPVNLPPLSLPRTQIAVTLSLPPGSEPGAYEVQLRDATGATLISASGRADIRDFVTTLDVTMDLRTITAGVHQLAVRRQGEGWHLFPVTIR